MVRKIIVAFCIAMLLCTPVHSIAAEPYQDSISNTYVQYARDLLPLGKITDDYVFYRSGQYEYELIIGDLDYNGSRFINNDIVTYYSFTTGTGYNSNFTYGTDSISEFSLDVTGGQMVYSNLGNYPRLAERGSDYEVYQTIFLFIVALCCVIRSIFNATRKR